jgi:Ca-activated chloride channel family protein
VNWYFQDKQWLVLMGLLVPVLLLWALYGRWKKRVRTRLGESGLVASLMPGYSPWRSRLRFFLLFLAFAAGVLALMNPSRPAPGTPLVKTGIDVVLALDISRSMLAADLPPSRLERARQFIGRLLELLPDDRIALVLFAGRAYLQMPLTADHDAARLYVAGATPEAIPQQGTVISEALEMSDKAFPSAAGQGYKSVVLITDGEGHDGGAVATARQLADKGVMICAVGIGSPQGTTIPDPLSGAPRKDAEGNVIVSKLNESLLRDLAEATRGIYVPLQSAEEAAAAVKKQLSQIDRRAYPDQRRLSFTRYYPWLAGLMLLLLGAELFWPEKKRINTLQPAA